MSEQELDGRKDAESVDGESDGNRMTANGLDAGQGYKAIPFTVKCDHFRFWGYWPEKLGYPGR